jgi:HPt (histidine-containing phosphotransfer) domain-containing protein
METNKSGGQDKKIIIKIDPEVSELIPAFLKNRETDTQLLFEALSKEDYEKIERIGHGMKGAGAGFGFDAITEIGARIEKSAKLKDVFEIGKEIQELSEYVRSIEVVYE